ncbi:MAG: tRNA (N6-threonylcarbamoyladenosine(37)-N6)-methyltransferase TrmO [Candidatus Aminicenantes bacterium]|nr:tRNA (N6-threonylcarbamoyladenosine(37)-N6)-methyltransferase TrmO [Candidatus Aminicenantes bacterium]
MPRPRTTGKAGKPTFRYEAVGLVRSPFKTPEEIPVERNADPRGFDDVRGKLVIDPACARGLKDIDGFSHLFVLFAFHRAGEAKLLSRPPFDTEPRGVFASRSPRRPNALGLTIVKLESRRGRVLHVSGLDMIDGTPILDIKPYTDRDRRRGARTGWLARYRRRAAGRGRKGAA